MTKKIKKFFFELRNRLILLLITFIILCLTLYFYKEFLSFLLIKITFLLDESVKTYIYFITTNISELFYSYVFLTLFASSIIVIYLFLYHIFYFLSSALFIKEFKLLIVFFKLSFLFLFIAVLFAYHFGILHVWSFFLNFQDSLDETLKKKVYFEMKFSDYINFCFYITFYFIVFFQLILIIFFLSIKYSKKVLKKYRKAHYFAIFLLIFFIVLFMLNSFFDLVFQTVLFFTLIFLYEMCNLFSIFFYKIKLIYEKI